MRPTFKNNFIASFCSNEPASSSRMKSSMFVLIVVGWILQITASASGQINSTSTATTAVPASTGSDNSIFISNPAPDIRALAQQAEQKRAICVNGRRRICGQVLQIRPEVWSWTAATPICCARN